MESEVARYNVRLQAWFRREGREWLAWCPTIEVMTQDRTKSGALASLREAVQLWFESCIDRGVLGEALAEAGFSTIAPGEPIRGANSVTAIHRPRRAARKAAGRARVSFSGRGKGTDYIIEGTIPAYVAAHQLGDAARAAS